MRILRFCYRVFVWVFAGMVFSFHSFAEDAAEEIQIESGAESEVQAVLNDDASSESENDSAGIAAMGVNSPIASTGSENQSVMEESIGSLKRFTSNYFAILFGPSVRRPSSYQPNADGTRSTDNPVLIKNNFNLGYNVTDRINVSGTANWSWQPVMKQQLEMLDPFMRVSHNSIISTDQWNLYGDLRVHFPVTTLSRENDMQVGLQSVQALTYLVPGSRFTLGMVGSVRGNRFGGYGYGNDMEFYLAPNVFYQVKSNLALTLLFEAQAHHSFGERRFPLVYSDGTDLEPGVSWDVTSSLNINPYFHIPLTGSAQFNATSIGMMLNWVLL